MPTPLFSFAQAVSDEAVYIRHLHWKESDGFRLTIINDVPVKRVMRWPLCP